MTSAGVVKNAEGAPGKNQGEEKDLRTSSNIMCK
jgi:hypothetical protein